MLVFSKKKFMDDMGPIDYEVAWTDRCDGKTIHECESMGYAVFSEWCIEVPDKIALTKKELFEEIEKKCLHKCVQYDKCVGCLEASGNTERAAELQEYNTRCRNQWK